MKFIVPSYQRATEIQEKTLKYLLSQGVPTQSIYIVVREDDEQIEQYRSIKDINLVEREGALVQIRGDHPSTRAVCGTEQALMIYTRETNDWQAIPGLSSDFQPKGRGSSSAGRSSGLARHRALCLRDTHRPKRDTKKGGAAVRAGDGRT